MREAMNAIPRAPFRPAAAFQPAGSGYRPLPFRFLRWSPDEVLLVNDAGEFCFLSQEEFLAFATGKLTRNHPGYPELKSRHFLVDSPSRAALESLAAQIRTRRSFLAGFTKLHLFVVTLRCDHTCRYCQVSRVSADTTRFDMDRETAAAAVELMFRSPARELKVEFQGGEPLLAFDLIRFLVARIEERNLTEGREIDYVIATNLAFLTQEILDFCREHRIALSTSLDGPAFLHDANRPRSARNSHRVTVENLEWARRELGPERISALMTTTERSLAHPREIVDEYVERGLPSIFLRPISPYGFAVKTGEALRYQTAHFLDFYVRGLAYIFELNRQGIEMVEVYAQILLTKIMTPFATGYVDLQSPAGAALSVVAYNHDGDVYASDEARMLASMGDTTYRLGNVHSHSYEEIFSGPVARSLMADSILEALPGCTDCSFLPYCGADPIFHYRTQGDPVGHRPTSAFCQRNMGIFRHLFGLLKAGDPFVRSTLASWATGIRLPTPEPA
jgi:uncharacterized protein